MKQLTCLIGALLLGGSAMADDEPPSKLDQMGACRADVKKLCPDVQPGGGRMVACLKQNEDRVSESCKEKIEGIQKRKNRNRGSNGQNPPSGKS
jgi:hypothetical protein